MILNSQGVPMAGAEQQQATQKIQEIMQVVIPLLVAAKADLNVAVSTGVNVILHAYSHIPPKDEKRFVENTVASLAQAFGHATAQKAEAAKVQQGLSKEVRRAVDDSLKH